MATLLTSTFEYNKLELNHFRLLRILDCKGRIKCQLITHGFGSLASPKYSCLSYVWGPFQAEPWHSIVLNGLRLNIQENLWLFLSMASANVKYCGIWLWIDAICINQKNILERNQQVSIMGDIYREAERVFAWIQGDDEYKRETLSCPCTSSRSVIRKLVKNFKHPHPKNSDLSFLIRVRSDRYWTRAWIVQELVQAKRITVLFEKSEMAGEDLFEVSLNSQKHFSHFSFPHDFASSPMDIRLKQSLSGTDTTTTLLSLLRNHSGLGCSDPLDRIYSLRSLTNEGNLIHVDYALTPYALFDRLMHFHSPRMCLCVPRLLLDVLNDSNERWNSRGLVEKTASSPYDTTESYFELVMPPVDSNKLHKQDDQDIRSCNCPCSHPTAKFERRFTFCLKNQCGVEPGSHLVFPIRNNQLNIYSATLFNSDGSVIDTIQFRHIPIFSSTYIKSRSTRTHMHLSLTGLSDFVQGIHKNNMAAWGKCRRARALGTSFGSGDILEYQLHSPSPSSADL